MALHLKVKPRTLHRRFPSIQPFSSSHPPPDSNGGEETSPSRPRPPPPPPPLPPSRSSYFSDIKERLKSPPTPPRRIPTDPTPPPSLSSPPTPSLDDIRLRLAEFRLKSPLSPSSTPPSPISFQELFKNNNNNLKSSDPTADHPAGGLSMESIRNSLRQFRPSPSRRDLQRPPGPPLNLNKFADSLKGPTPTPSLLWERENLPESVFGRELREKKGEGETERALKTQFVKTYSCDELGEKLRKLRPAETKGGKELGSLEELNERLAKLRELEEKETEARMGGVYFRDLRNSLTTLQNVTVEKKLSMQGLSILTDIGLGPTPKFMLKPPQEHLLENYFHPDHMSSAEKMKLELNKARDEFKMSESDCGSARVQVAQLTTKIKHLSSVLHKKDKHSRKGLHEMVQRRKKLLKYLRRTDWDSYTLVLSKLGLRDVPEYKTPDYKLKA